MSLAPRLGGDVAADLLPASLGEIETGAPVGDVRRTQAAGEHDDGKQAEAAAGQPALDPLAPRDGHGAADELVHAAQELMARIGIIDEEAIDHWRGGLVLPSLVGCRYRD
jgi:hypothetical protein